MKKNLKSKKRITGYFKKVIDRAKPIQEKVEKILAASSLFQKLSKDFAPLQKKILANFTVKLNKAKDVAGSAKKEIKDFNAQYTTEPKKTITDAVIKARCFAKDSWKKRQLNKQSTVSAKPLNPHVAKKEKRESSHP